MEAVLNVRGRALGSPRRLRGRGARSVRGRMPDLPDGRWSDWSAPSTFASGERQPTSDPAPGHFSSI